MKEKVYFRINF